MTVLRISDASRDALRLVAGLEDDAVQELASFLSANLDGLLSQDDTYSKSGSLKRIEHDQAFQILDALVPLVFGHLSTATDPKSAVDDIVRAVCERHQGPKWTKAEERRIKQAFSRLLLDPQTLLKSKSVRLRATQAKNFADCEVLSDIRPVFSTDGKLAAEAAVTCHTLRIGYSKDAEVLSFFVSLDSRDLNVLKKAIDRALAKDEVLEGVIGRSGLLHVKVT